MIAYDKTGLDALRTLDATQEWHRKGLLSDEKWQEIQAHYLPKFYSPNVFVRIGLGIFTLILLISSMGMAYMIAGTSSETSSAMLCFLFGILTFVALEKWAIGTARHFGSGVDDMLLYYGTGLLIGSIYILLPYNTPELVYACIALPFLVVGSIRYLDRLMALGTFLCLLLIIGLIVKDIPRFALYALPFSGMLYALAMYMFAQSGQKKYEWRHGHNSLVVIEMLALVTFYISGNYWVIQQAGAAMFELEQVPMAGFFWAFTFGVPLLYIFGGLRNKDRLLLDIGLACIAAAVFTFRNYFHVMSLAWAAVIAGAVLFVTAYFSIRYLHKNEGAYTYEADGDSTLLQEIEEQLLEQTIAAQNPPTQAARSESFGGGEFGGGGSGGQF